MEVRFEDGGPQDGGEVQTLLIATQPCQLSIINKFLCLNGTDQEAVYSPKWLHNFVLDISCLLEISNNRPIASSECPSTNNIEAFARDAQTVLFFEKLSVLLLTGHVSSSVATISWAVYRDLQHHRLLLHETLARTWSGTDIAVCFYQSPRSRLFWWRYPCH